ncbi:MAG: hypothetical protein EPO16_12790 [Dehalococcoidia bacterium]|nr:MAG: hypothetical protein EPO16_12790 [Dehalococcoidia bacterium]
MSPELVVIRILHVLPGVVWVGGASVMAWVVEPQLRAAGPAVQAPAMRAIGKVLPRVLSSAAGVTILMGLVLVARTPGYGFGDLFTTAWGWAIGLGLVASVASAAIGGRAGGAMKRMEALGAQISGAPTAAQAAEMTSLQAGLRQGARVGAVLGLIAVALMVSARYV